MGALTAVTPTTTGATVAGAAVAASDTIATSQMGPKGVHLEIINGNASPDSVTITDAGTTQAGNSPGTIPGTVTNGTSKVFKIFRSQAAPSTGLVTITHSVTSTVTYKMYKI